MTVTIVQRGPPPAPSPDPLFRAECRACQTVFTFNLSDSNFSSIMAYGESIRSKATHRLRSISCPVCTILAFEDTWNPADA